MAHPKRSRRVSASEDRRQPPCPRAPRMVIVAQAILTLQGRLDSIRRREDVLDAEFDKLESEKASKVSELSVLQREMDKLTSTHHVVQQ